MERTLVDKILKKTFLGSKEKILDLTDLATNTLIQEYRFYVARFNIAIKTMISIDDYCNCYIPQTYYKN